MPTLRLVPFVVAVPCALLVGINLLFVEFSKPLLYDGIAALPRRKVALVLGASSVLRSGQPNPFFTGRIQAAAWLWQTGRADYILVSGDNQYESYNEPRKMWQALREAGVPDANIVLDYAGFSTLDSMVRASLVFGQDELIVVSQAFQNQRAVLIGSAWGMRPIAYNAPDPGGWLGLQMAFREFFARPKAFLDLYFLGTQPRFLGEAVTIP